MDYVFLNDRIVPAEEARISVFDAGLLHGVGLCETLRSYRGQVFRAEDHLNRLENAARQLGLQMTQAREEIMRGIEQLLQVNEVPDALLRLTMTRGIIRAFTEDAASPSTLIITTDKLDINSEPPARSGIMVLINPYKVNPDDPLISFKSLNNFTRLLALQQAHRYRAAEILTFTLSNHLAGAALNNVFLVLDNVLLTPSLDTPAFDGITRRLVMTLAAQEQLECQERRVTIKDVLAAQEIFLTGTIAELLPVARVEKHVVGDETPGPIYSRLHKRYRELTLAQA